VPKDGSQEVPPTEIDLSQERLEKLKTVKMTQKSGNGLRGETAPILAQNLRFLKLRMLFYSEIFLAGR